PIGKAQEPALASRKSIGRRRILLEKTPYRRREVRQRGCVRFAQVVQCLGSRASERPPRLFCLCVLRVAHTLPRFEQRRQFIRREFAETLEPGMPGKRSDAYQTHYLPAGNS